MPMLFEFDSETVRPTTNRRPDTQMTVNFPNPLVARPRLSHGLRLLDIGKDTDIRVKSTNMYFTNTWVDYHITTWDDTTLYKAIDNLFVLTPADLQFLTGKHMRNLLIHPEAPASVRISFKRPFATPPKVVVFFNFIDLSKGHNWRLRTTATNIDVNGFTLTIESWLDTVLHAAQACWVAYPEDEEHIFSASVSTGDVHSPSSPQLQSSKAITFNTVEFRKKPSVFVALNSFDIGCNANLRVNAFVDDVTQNGLVWHIDTWADTLLYSASASIIAFNN